MISAFCLSGSVYLISPFSVISTPWMFEAIVFLPAVAAGIDPVPVRGFEFPVMRRFKSATSENSDGTTISVNRADQGKDAVSQQADEGQAFLRTNPCWMQRPALVYFSPIFFLMWNGGQPWM